MVRRKLYHDMPGLLPVDLVMNPNEALASVILRTIRYSGHALALSMIEKIDAEMWEVELPKGHPMTDKPLKELALPKGVLVALVDDGSDVVIPDGNTQMRAGDKLILFATTKLMPSALKLFGEGGASEEEKR